MKLTIDKYNAKYPDLELKGDDGLNLFDGCIFVFYTGDHYIRIYNDPVMI